MTTARAYEAHPSLDPRSLHPGSAARGERILGPRWPVRASAGAAAFVVATALTMLAPTPSAAEPQPSLRAVKAKVQVLYHRGEIATERYNAARIRSKRAADKLQQIRRRAASQERTVSTLQSAEGAYAAAVYRSGGIDSTLQLMLADSPQQFVEQAASLSQLAERRADILRRAQVARTRLAQQRLAAAQQAAALERERAAVAADKAETERHLASAQRLLAGLRAEQRARLAAQQARERRAALAARAAAAANHDAAALAGRTSSRTSRSTSRPPIPALVPSPGRGAAAASFANAQLGDAYVYGAAGPSAWDCSGLTMGAWAAAGVSLPHNTSMQYAATTPVSLSALQPGDLVFFYSIAQHVGIYVGGGNVIHASHPGQPVNLAPVSSMPAVAASRP